MGAGLDLAASTASHHLKELRQAGLAAYGLPGPGLFASWLHLPAWLALAPHFTSFMLMNFTGASTYTSLSGVLREMRFAVPAQVSAGVVGLVLWLTGLFVPGIPAR